MIILTHEKWLLTPNQVTLAKVLPKPIDFTAVTLTNGLIFLGMLIGIGIWIVVGRKFEKKILLRLPIDKDWSPFFVRVCTGSMLVICALGLFPRVGIQIPTPTLFAPDLILRPESLINLFLLFFELLIGLMFLSGVYVRSAAFMLFCLLLLGLALLGAPLIAYFGFYAGIAGFLIVLGGGKFSLTNLNYSPSLQIKSKTQFLLQMCTGLNFIYSALVYKFMQPNLDITILEMHNAFTFGMSYEKFTLLMAFIECGVGFLILTGVLLPLLSILLFLLFLFLSFNLNENPLMHLFIYGILFAFIINGSGEWSFRHSKRLIS